MRQRRFENHSIHATKDLWQLADTHDAIVENRPLFNKVISASKSPRLFISGFNSRKLGGRVTKGAWAGMPIYQLSLPERTTCPRYCHAYNSCYGNAMPFARRHEPGVELEEHIPIDIARLSELHPKGFVIRLHVLGDFYSPGYVNMWFKLMGEHRQLRLFGYTARNEEQDRDIFTRVAVLNAVWPERCSIRYSRILAGERHVIVVKTKDEVNSPNIIVCPAQTEASECCATCGLCWSPAAFDKTIAFIEHGPTKSRRKA